MQLSSDMSAIVTGGASGLGEASARKLAASGVKVTLFDMNEERGQQVAEDIGGLFQLVDVTSEDSIKAGLAAARVQYGQERILVNCAGIVVGQKTISRDRETGAVKPHDLSVFARVVQVNLCGTFNMIALSSAGMAGLEPVTGDGGRGVIVCTSSIAGVEGQMGQVAYAASKGGILGLTLPVARDLARDGIRIVSIMPGLFHTPMFDGLPQDVRDSLGSGVPFPSRLGNPEEFAETVEHICRNDMLNGTSIRLDGAIRLEPR
ncbi:SDR family NAD(P)-dependent oxidoreductase [Coralliovum pocilloporae]|uniref:SDR family NAD(P)-dependent oxidoreductase n=1 Tax=Coralliovum pocilloporae TaxID=3066369 RepID=UPI00330798B4